MVISLQHENKGLQCLVVVASTTLTEGSWTHLLERVPLKSIIQCFKKFTFLDITPPATPEKRNHDEK
jgi:hypothetical protein